MWTGGWCVDEWMVCGRVDGVWTSGWCVDEWMVCGRVDGVWTSRRHRPACASASHSTRNCRTRLGPRIRRTRGPYQTCRHSKNAVRLHIRPKVRGVRKWNSGRLRPRVSSKHTGGQSYQAQSHTHTHTHTGAHQAQSRTQGHTRRSHTHRGIPGAVTHTGDGHRRTPGAVTHTGAYQAQSRAASAHGHDGRDPHRPVSRGLI